MNKKPTLVQQTSAEDMALYQAGTLSHFIDKFKVLPEIGQRVLLQTDTSELEATVCFVRKLDGINALYTVVGFKASAAGGDVVLNLGTGNLEKEVSDQLS